ncbi:MAG: cbb3-type cytochrome c oxidase subunit I [Sediminibacterium sp.]|nr:cbb3-type cytochrome c oxidase subunit I [Sediminibacterium sp.]MDP3667321.1 cbb3-type cytochrome c oxidase subunit I [Sediminibacterium sp.]
MEPLNNNQPTTIKLFMVGSLLLLALGMLFGWIGALQYLVPGFLVKWLSFEKIRPLHVSSVVFWIILAAMGSVLIYVQEHTGRKLYSALLTRLQLSLFSLSIPAIFISYCMGVFGGREYWEFPPVLALPIIAGWILFLINFTRSFGTFKQQPVYIWMWLTGIIFFLFTFLESYLWVFPYFRNNIINDMTVQWKSYGSMVGAWNMLIYGSSIFLMQKISGHKNDSHSRMAFALYFTGLFNLMFNWGHHIYTLPTYHFIQYISYVVSMTELLILGRIIWQWKSSVSKAAIHFHHTAFRFLVAADIWIFLSLLLAVLMSVPAINVYTHGTHITVAHAMGTTIGINSFLLLAIAVDTLSNSCSKESINEKWITKGYWITNISLFIFWISLVIAGILKAKWQMSTEKIPFSTMMLQLRPFFIVFLFSGLTMIAGFFIILYPILKKQISCYLVYILGERNPAEEPIRGTISMD